MLHLLFPYLSYILVVNGLFDFALAFLPSVREIVTKPIFGSNTDDMEQVLVLHGLLRFFSGMTESGYGRKLAAASYAIESYYALKAYVTGKSKFVKTAPVIFPLSFLSYVVYVSASDV